MDENSTTHLDIEFKRYLQIMRPYLGQLVDQHVIEICKAWIQRLSNCKENEKCTRNKYVFQLCYQLAKGVLDEPFVKSPPEHELAPIRDCFESECSTEVEYVVIDAEEPHTKVLFNCKKPIVSETEYLSQDIEFDDERRDDNIDFDIPREDQLSQATHKQTILCYTCPEIMRSTPKDASGEIYEFRANNLIMKLREIKNQNMILHNELLALREESRMRHEENEADLIKVDNATSAFMQNESSTTLKSLKSKLQEVQGIRNTLIASITNLQEQLFNFNDMKKHEIEEIEAKHKLEILKIKSTVRDEANQILEDKMKEVKQQYESKIEEIKLKTETEIQNVHQTKDEIIINKDKIIQEKEAEIDVLKIQFEEQKAHLNSILNKFIEKPEQEPSTENIKMKAQELEKRLNRVEKSKAKCAKNFETKLAYLQREKHLAECSLQLQLVRQRAQIVNEIADESQVELNSALDKLETKYKDIVANVQATAIQRRMQDQLALEAILQAACGTQNESMYCSTNLSQFSTMRKDQSYDNEVSGLLRHKAVNKTKSFGEDSVTPGYCLDSERLGELFEKVYIPQRDTGDGSLKK